MILVDLVLCNTKTSNILVLGSLEEQRFVVPQYVGKICGTDYVLTSRKDLGNLQERAFLRHLGVQHYRVKEKNFCDPQTHRDLLLSLSVEESPYQARLTRIIRKEMRWLPLYDALDIMSFYSQAL